MNEKQIEVNMHWTVLKLLTKTQQQWPAMYQWKTIAFPSSVTMRLYSTDSVTVRVHWLCLRHLRVVHLLVLPASVYIIHLCTSASVTCKCLHHLPVVHLLVLRASVYVIYM